MRRTVLTGLPAWLMGACSLVRAGLAQMRQMARNLGFQECILERPGLRVRYWKGGSGPPMLLLHGFGGDGISTWIAQLGELSRLRTVILPDLLWFGESWSMERPGLAAQGRAMLQVLEAEGIRAGGQYGQGQYRVDVMGVSYGGFVTFMLASLRPGIFGRVVIVDSPGPWFEPEDQRALLTRFGVQAAEDIFVIEQPEQVQALLDLALYRDRKLPGFILRDMYRQIFSAWHEEQRALIRELPEHRGLGQGVALSSHPPLILWGSDDEVFPLSSGQRLAAQTGGQLVVIPETAHGPMTERPDAFNSALIGWLVPDERTERR